MMLQTLIPTPQMINTVVIGIFTCYKDTSFFYHCIFNAVMHRLITLWEDPIHYQIIIIAF